MAGRLEYLFDNVPVSIVMSEYTNNVSWCASYTYFLSLSLALSLSLSLYIYIYKITHIVVCMTYICIHNNLLFCFAAVNKTSALTTEHH